MKDCHGPGEEEEKQLEGYGARANRALSGNCVTREKGINGFEMRFRMKSPGHNDDLTGGESEIPPGIGLTR